MFFLKHGFEKTLFWPKNFISDWKALWTGRIYGTRPSPYMYYLCSNSHVRKPFVKVKIYLFVKIEICSKLSFLSNIGLKRLSSDSRNLHQTENTLSTGRIYGTWNSPYMSYLSCNPHKKKKLFSSQRYTTLWKLRFAQNCIFHQTWVWKDSLLTKKFTSDWKNFINKENLWNLSFAIHV